MISGKGFFEAISFWEHHEVEDGRFRAGLRPKVKRAVSASPRSQPRRTPTTRII